MIMRKIIPYFILVTGIFAQFSIKAIDPITVAATFGPLLKPLVEKEIEVGRKALLDVITKLGSKKFYCENTCSGVGILSPCRTKLGLSACKASCQKIVQMGGYEIRIRFWNLDKQKNKEEKSLASCLRTGVNTKVQGSDGKANVKSIAIYSQDDLLLFNELLAYKKAAEKVIASKGSLLTIDVSDEEVSLAEQRPPSFMAKWFKSKPTRPQIHKLLKDEKMKHALEDAEQVRAHVEAEIQTMIKSGRFGNQ